MQDTMQDACTTESTCMFNLFGHEVTITEHHKATYGTAIAYIAANREVFNETAEGMQRKAMSGTLVNLDEERARLSKECKAQGSEYASSHNNTAIVARECVRRYPEIAAVLRLGSSVFDGLYPDVKAYRAAALELMRLPGGTTKSAAEWLAEPANAQSVVTAMLDAKGKVVANA